MSIDQIQTPDSNTNDSGTVLQKIAHYLPSIDQQRALLNIAGDIEHMDRQIPLNSPEILKRQSYELERIIFELFPILKELIIRTKNGLEKEI